MKERRGKDVPAVFYRKENPQRADLLKRKIRLLRGFFFIALFFVSSDMRYAQS